MSINMSRPFVQSGNEGILDGNTGAVVDSLTQLITTRGTIDLSESRLPNANDVSVRPTDPLIAYDAFVVSTGGTVVSGVGGTTTLSPGDYLVLANDNGSTTASNWIGWPNSAVPPNPTNPLSGAILPGRVVGARLPFFP